MKYNPKQELQVLYCIRELGEATKTEIIEEYKRREYEPELDDYWATRILRRWKKRKLLVTNPIKGQNLWSLADVPFPPRVQMIHLQGLTHKDAEVALMELEEAVETGKTIVPTKGKYKDYKRVKCVFEAVDYILGGVPAGQNLRLFPKNPDKKPIIRRNWMKGYIRDNGAILDMTGRVHSHIGVSEGVLPDDLKLERKTAMTPKGPCTYEAVPPKTRFEMTFWFPFKGTEIQSLEEFKAFFEMIEEAPIRGLGANPSYYGGRIRLVEATIQEKE